MLAARTAAGHWPQALELPTASGKTACIDVAIHALPSQSERPLSGCMGRFRGVVKVEFLDQRHLRGPAFKLLEEAELFCQRHFALPGRIEPGRLQPVDRPLIPPESLKHAHPSVQRNPIQSPRSSTEPASSRSGAAARTASPTCTALQAPHRRRGLPGTCAVSSIRNLTS